MVICQKQSAVPYLISVVLKFLKLTELFSKILNKEVSRLRIKVMSPSIIYLKKNLLKLNSGLLFTMESVDLLLIYSVWKISPRRLKIFWGAGSYNIHLDNLRLIMLDSCLLWGFQDCWNILRELIFTIRWRVCMSKQILLFLLAIQLRN